MSEDLYRELSSRKGTYPYHARELNEQKSIFNTRRALKGLVGASVLGLVMWFGQGSEASNVAPMQYDMNIESEHDLHTYIVKPGDNLFKIAGNHNPHNKDLRELKDKIMEANGLEDITIHPEQELDLSVLYDEID